MIGARVFAATLLATMLVGPTSASDLKLERPDYKVGDRWEFEGVENGQPTRWSRAIVEFKPDGRFVARTIRNGREQLDHYDGSMNFLNAGRVDRARLFAKYPMKVGDAWRFTLTFDNPNDFGEIDARVVAAERITVPAGAFDCLKVEAQLTAAQGRSRQHFERTTRWYCPEIKYIARELVSRGEQSTSNPAERVSRENDSTLVRFTPGP